MYRKGELSPVSVDRGWPHQVALPASASLNGGYKIIRELCKDLSLCPRGHSVFREEWFNVYCFTEAEHAERFMAKFGGERFYPSQRGRGAKWAMWKNR